MKKTRFSLTALTIVLILFAGCTKEKTTSTTTATSTSKSAEQVVAVQAAKKHLKRNMGHMTRMILMKVMMKKQQRKSN